MIFPIAQSLKSDTSRTSHPAIILKDVPPSSDLTRDESFAPILTVERASSVSHAIRLANSHDTGLSASIFTSNHLEALDVARQLESGAVHINRMTIHDEHSLSHGGVKASGWGRFNSRGAVESFTYMKSVTLGGGMMLPLDAI